MKGANEQAGEDLASADVGLNERSTSPITLEVIYQGMPSQFTLQKIDQKSFHGFRRRVGLDHEGQECETALLAEDGRHLLTNGCTAEMYCDENGDVVERKDLVACDVDGNPLPELPATLEEPQTISCPVPATEFLNHVVTAVYLLQVETLDPTLEASLEAGEIYRVPFRPRKTHHDNPAFLLKGVDSYFLVVTEQCRFEFSRPGQVIVFSDEDDHELAADDYFDAGFEAWGGLP
jgi:hypothetical protein